MKRINLIRACRVQMDDGTIVKLGAGLQHVKDDVAAHWYVQAHCRAMREELGAAKEPPEHVKAILAQSTGAAQGATQIDKFAGTSVSGTDAEGSEAPPTRRNGRGKRAA